MRPDPRDAETRTIQQAGKLARSGAYACWQEVQAALLEQGYVGARKALNGALLRELLDNHCSEAREKRHA